MTLKIILSLVITSLIPSMLCLQLAVFLLSGPLYPQHTFLLEKTLVLHLAVHIQLYIPVDASENTQRHCDCTPCTKTLCLRGIDTPSPMSASTASETVKLTSGFPGCFEELYKSIHSVFLQYVLCLLILIGIWVAH